jgi:hypothetical protein
LGVFFDNPQASETNANAAKIDRKRGPEGQERIEYLLVEYNR